MCAAHGEGLLTFAGLHETWRHPPPQGMGAADAADFQTCRVTPRMNSQRFEAPAAIEPLNEPDLFTG